MRKTAICAVWIIFVLASIPLRSVLADEALPGEIPAEEIAPGEDIPNITPPVQEIERDPFASPFEGSEVVAPVPGEGAAPIEIKFDGVGIGPGDAFAILNGDIYYEGEEKNGIKVIRVGKQEVELLADGIPQTVKLVLEDEIKRLEKRKQQKTGVKETLAQDPN